MRALAAIAALVAAFVNVTRAQQYAGDVIPNSLPTVPGSEITYFQINDPSGKNKNLTLTNYYSHGKTTTKRLVEANVQRAVVIVHGLNRDPGTYMSNMLSALAQVKSDPNVNFDTVAIMAPYFPNGDDKTSGYPWTDGLSAGKGSTSNALVWKASQWSAGGNNQYPSNSKNTSSYTVLDQIIQYFDNATLFPKMQQIVIAGHSLGGQTVQRYAAIGAQLNTRSPVSYWVGNPNSYVWLSTARPLPTAGCSIYDDYREGYSAFTDYPMTYGVGLVNAGRAAVLANYNSKAINYGRGTQDLGDDSSTCAPSTTGKDRNERFFNFIKAFPPTCSNPAGRNCDTVDFVNVGHDGGAMMASVAGQARLFLDNFYGNGNRSFDFGYPRQQAGDDPYPNPALNTTSASINNNTYAGNMTYWGCWSDQNPQTLTNMTYSSNANTIELCSRTCASGNNSIAGLEFGTQCFCGSSLGYRAQQVIESSCQNTCPGNASEMCGGYNRLSIFSNGRPQLQPTPGTPETVGDFTYISCYTEASSGRALTGTGTSTNSMTLEFCANYCSGYQYFGTEYGAECYCGNSFSAGANRTSDGDCGMLCANNPAEFCGAGNRLTVYQDPDWVAPSSASTSTGVSSTTSSTPSATGSPTTAVSCPASNNTVVISSGKNFTIECGVDHQGGDLTSLSVNNFQQCIDACAQNGKCVDVSLSGSACYLKSTLGAAVQNGAIWGAKLVVESASSSTASSSTVSTSSSSTSIVPTLSTTMTSSASGSDARTSTTTTTSSTTSRSASNTPITCPASNDTTIVSNGVSFLIECGIDHAGGDMKALTVSGFQQCIDACASTPGCVDLSMSGNACYLKSSLGGAIKNNVWGAKVVQAAASSLIASSTSTTSGISSASGSSDASIVSSTALSISPGTSSTVPTSSDSSISSGSFTTTAPSTTFSGSSSSAGSTSTLASSSSSTSSDPGTTSSVSTTSSSLSSSASDSSATVSSSMSSASSVVSSTMQSTSSTTSSSGSASSSSASLQSSSTSSPSVSPALTPSTSSSFATSTTSTSLSSSISAMSSLATSLATSLTTSLTSSPTSSTTSSLPTTLSTSTTTSSASTSSAPATLPSGFSSLGCFIDSNTRLLPTANGTSTTQTPQTCALACQARGFKYSGTEYAQECWCGNNLPPSTASAASSQCSMRCTGDKTQMCGAGNRLSVVVDNTWKQTFFVRESYAKWTLVGCYVDSASARALPVSISLAAYGGSSNATIAHCLEACQAKGHLYCGEEYYSECYGYGVLPSSTALAGDPLAAGCNLPCLGNKTEACGGSNRILVYENHVPGN